MGRPRGPFFLQNLLKKRRRSKAAGGGIVCNSILPQSTQKEAWLHNIQTRTAKFRAIYKEKILSFRGRKGGKIANFS